MGYTSSVAGSIIVSNISNEAAARIRSTMAQTQHSHLWSLKKDDTQGKGTFAVCAYTDFDTECDYFCEDAIDVFTAVKDAGGVFVSGSIERIGELELADTERFVVDEDTHEILHQEVELTYYETEEVLM